MPDTGIRLRSLRRTSPAPPAAALLAGALLAATAAAAPAGPEKLDVRPGLWEITSSAAGNTPMQLPDAALALLTPEQQARMQAMMRRAAGPHVFTNCVTQEQIDTGFRHAAGNDPSCTSTVLLSSPTELKIHHVCGGSRSRTVDLHFLAPNPQTVNGTVHFETGNGDKPLAIDRTFAGRWLGTDCGTVQPGRPLVQ